MDNSNLPLARLGRSNETPFTVEPDADARRALAEELQIEGLRKLRFTGQLTPEGKDDWTLTARLGMTAVQACVVTLEPVVTRIDTDVVRHYRADVTMPADEEAEMPEDDAVEPLPRTLDLMAVMAEAVALALPDYPRAEGVALGEAVYAAPGIKPMTDEDAKPLAGLAALRDRLSSDEDGA